MSEHTPTPEQTADAIEILSMCEPISEVQGGMWFGRNHDLADATFVDYGACRAFAVAARALPVLVKRQDMSGEVADRFDLAISEARLILKNWQTTFSDEPLEDRVHKAQEHSK